MGDGGGGGGGGNGMGDGAEAMWATVATARLVSWAVQVEGAAGS